MLQGSVLYSSAGNMVSDATTVWVADTSDTKTRHIGRQQTRDAGKRGKELVSAPIRSRRFQQVTMFLQLRAKISVQEHGTYRRCDGSLMSGGSTW